MAKYLLTISEIYHSKYEVEANSPEEAYGKILDNKSLEPVQTDRRSIYGEKGIQDQDLAFKVRELGYETHHDFIPGLIDHRKVT